MNSDFIWDQNMCNVWTFSLYLMLDLHNNCCYGGATMLNTMYLLISLVPSCLCSTVFNVFMFVIHPQVATYVCWSLEDFFYALYVHNCPFLPGRNRAEVKVAFSRKGLWKYSLLRFFIIFSSKFMTDHVIGWIWIQISILSQSQASSKI